MKQYLLIALLFIVALFSLSAHSQPQTPKGWEYKLEYKVTEQRANALAAEGWELLGAGNNNAGNVSVAFLIFRRAK